MIGKNGKSADTDFGVHNQIAQGTTINGDIKTEGVLRVDGTLIGSIESSGKVVVGPSGKIDGSIRCASANISGTVKAKLIVKDMLELQSSAKLTGEITVGKLSIQPGATFSGSCSMGGVIKELTREEQKELAEKTA
ncbi:MAG: polymer-forming cytoskeletal protein [Flavobacteriales bacterium]